MSPSEAVAAYGSQKAAAEALGVPRTTFRRKLKAEKGAPKKPAVAKGAGARGARGAIEFPELPSKDAPIADVIARLAADSRRKSARTDAERWMPVHVRDKLPIALMCFGDPHLGTSTDWGRLERDVYTCASEPGVYGVNIGDTTNNWTGRLMRLYADEDISARTERRLAKWFLAETGIMWLVWITGNHDEWNAGADILRLMNTHAKVPMLDWSARFELVFPKGQKVKVHAAHDFPGHSMWNKTHGPSRAAQMTSDADLYLCGHRHTWGIQHFELAERRRCPVAVRVGTYKRNDPYATRLGYTEDQHGSSMLVVIDPTAGPAGRVLPFVDIDQGVKVLRALRGGK